MMKEGVFARDAIGCGYITDSRREAVDLIVRSLPHAVRARLKPAFLNSQLARHPFAAGSLDLAGDPFTFSQRWTGAWRHQNVIFVLSVPR